MMKRVVLLCCVVASVFAEGDYYFRSGKKVKLEPIHTYSRITQKVDYYKTEQGVVVGVGDTLLLKIKKDVDIQPLLQTFHLSIVQKFSNNLFLLKTPSKKDTLVISNELHQREDIVFAHPNFLKKNRIR